MNLSNDQIANAMVGGIQLPNVRESNACFIKLSLLAGSNGSVIYDLGAWGAVFANIDGSPDKARQGWLDSKFTDKFSYISDKMRIRVESAIAIQRLHQQYSILHLAELLRNGEVDIVRIH